MSVPEDLCTSNCYRVLENVSLCLERSPLSFDRVFLVERHRLEYQCIDNDPSYLKKHGVIKAITNELDNTCYATTGDWNANLRDIDNSVFAGRMLNFCWRII